MDIKRNHITIQEEKQHTKLFPGFKFKLGDKVKIINPRKHQLDTGVIKGAMRTGFARIQTSEGDIICRIPENLQKIP